MAGNVLKNHCQSEMRAIIRAVLMPDIWRMRLDFFISKKEERNGKSGMAWRKERYADI